VATAQQNPSALSSLISSPTTETRPAPPVACQTTKPLPCSLFAGPCGPLLLEPLSPTTAFRSPSRLCLAPATTPAAAVVPMLALTFTQSFTLLVVLPTGLMLYVRVSRHGIVSAGNVFWRFQGTEYRSVSLIPQQQVFAIRHRLRLDSLARAFAPLTVELFIVGFESNGNICRRLLCTQRRALSSARFRLSPRRKLPAQAEVERARAFPREKDSTARSPWTGFFGVQSTAPTTAWLFSPCHRQAIVHTKTPALNQDSFDDKRRSISMSPIPLTYASE
jgi:hypothetical protein